MKRRVIGLLLSVALVFGVIGCGNSTEQKQDESSGTGQESNVEQEQEEDTERTVKNDIPGEEISWGYIYDEPQETDYTPGWEYYDLSDSVQIVTAKEADIYDDEGNIIGYGYANQTMKAFAVAADYVKADVFIGGKRVEVNVRHEDLKDPSQLKDLFAATKQETEENDVDGWYARMVFERILEQGGMESSMELIQVSEESSENGGIFIYVPRENTGDWAIEKRQAFLDKGLKYYYIEGYGCTKYTVSLRIWLGTGDKKPIAAEEAKAFFQTEADREINKKSNYYYDLFEKVSFDSEKTYTTDEYIEFITKMGEELGIVYNEELEQEKLGTYDDFILSRMTCENLTYQAMAKILYYIERGQFYTGGIEFCIIRGQKDGNDIIGIISKSKTSADQ